ncbi:hypothetical protein C9890_0267 [Perkinsus sp. BL_2016]|nr:hypothetical protein C9890_0267 [Perkinsus sp. BL_2016]
MVRLLLQFRPDLRFVEDSMVRLALLMQGATGGNDETVVNFMNMVHAGIFLDFFCMRWSYMHMRFDFFEKIVHERLPLVFEHFSLLNITTDMYLRPWLLTGFSKVLPLRSALRVWDGFVLLGEAHLFSVAIGLLTLMEHRLMTQTFAGCIDILTGKKIHDSKKLFKLVHDRPVSCSRLAAWLATQILAEEKQTLYDLLV